MMQQTGATGTPPVLDISTLSMFGNQSVAVPCYIFNMDSVGWVIVSGDDVAYPVIGYSTNRLTNPQNLPPAFIEWMKQIEEQLRSAIKQNRQQPGNDLTTGKIQDAWAKLSLTKNKKPAPPTADTETGTSVLPLLKTTWNQDKYYNAECPYDPEGSDNRAMAGGCAIAVGQIMKFHEWPLSGSGSHTNYCDYGSLYVDFEAATYDWKSMPEKGSLDSYSNAVATLLYHIGISVDMVYGPESSGCYLKKVAPGLKNHFKYEANDYKKRSSYNSSDWLGMLVTDLNAKRPIIYRGMGTDGHAFVCDGYSEKDYFHFNWGFDGHYDGYFYLNHLTPGGQSYNNEQGAILGIRPKTADLIPHKPSNWNHTISVSKTPLSSTDNHVETEPYYDDETLYVNHAYFNRGSETAEDFTIRLEVTGTGDKSWSYTRSSLLPDYYACLVSDDIAIGPLPAGTHTLKIWLDSGNNVTENNESNNYLERIITISPRSPADLIPYKPLSWNDRIPIGRQQLSSTDPHNDTGPYYDNEILYINHAYRNQGEGGTSNFTIKLKVTGEGGDNWNYTRSSLSPDYYACPVFNDIAIGPLSTGTHTLKIWVDYENHVAESDESNNYYERDVTISPHPKADLTPYKPSIWNDKIPIGRQQLSGTEIHDDTGPYFDNETLYINHEYHNQGEEVAENFTVKLEVTGAGGEIWSYTKSSLLPNHYSYWTNDIAIGPLSTGTHTLKLWVDYENSVDEYNKSNNYYERDVTISSHIADLTPYKPSVWNDKIPIGRQQLSGTDIHNDTGPYYNDELLYINLSYLNQGKEDANNYLVRLEITGTGGEIKSFIVSSIQSGSYIRSNSDIAIGPLSTGTHTFKMWVDYENRITESNESNNFYERTVTIHSRNFKPKTETQKNHFQDKVFRCIDDKMSKVNLKECKQKSGTIHKTEQATKKSCRKDHPAVVGETTMHLKTDAQDKQKSKPVPVPRRITFKNDLPIEFIYPRMNRIIQPGEELTIRYRIITPTEAGEISFNLVDSTGTTLAKMTRTYVPLTTLDLPDAKLNPSGTGLMTENDTPKDGKPAGGDDRAFLWRMPNDLVAESSCYIKASKGELQGQSTIMRIREGELLTPDVVSRSGLRITIAGGNRIWHPGETIRAHVDIIGMDGIPPFLTPRAYREKASSDGMYFHARNGMWGMGISNDPSRNIISRSPDKHSITVDFQLPKQGIYNKYDETDEFVLNFQHEGFLGRSAVFYVRPEGVAETGISFINPVAYTNWSIGSEQTISWRVFGFDKPESLHFSLDLLNKETVWSHIDTSSVRYNSKSGIYSKTISVKGSRMATLVNRKKGASPYTASFELKVKQDGSSDSVLATRRSDRFAVTQPHR